LRNLDLSMAMEHSWLLYSNAIKAEIQRLEKRLERTFFVIY